MYDSTKSSRTFWTLLFTGDNVSHHISSQFIQVNTRKRVPNILGLRSYLLDLSNPQLEQ